MDAREAEIDGKISKEGYRQTEEAGGETEMETDICRRIGQNSRTPLCICTLECRKDVLGRKNVNKSRNPKL